MQIETDLLVIGAGPAGSMAAKTASQEGVDVLLIDKKAEIGSPKRCAEGITTNTLDELGIVKNDKWITRSVNGIRIVSSDGSEVTLDDERHNLPFTGYILERKIFDKQMAMDAARNGTKILLRTQAKECIRKEGYVIVKAKQFDEEITIKTKIVIAADGPESIIGKKMGLNTKIPVKDMASCIQYEMVGINKDNMNHIDIFIGNVAPGGYLWIFPKGDDIANVGLGVLKSHTDNNAKYHLDNFINNHNETQNAQAVEVNVGGDTVCPALDERYDDNVMIVGDAARFINPLTGDGIKTALLSGKYAAEVAVKSIKNEDYSKEFLKEYYDITEEKINQYHKKYNKIKEFLLTLDDSQLNKIIRELSNTQLDEISIKVFVKAIIKAAPKSLLKLNKLL